MDRMGGISLAGSQKVAGAQQRVRGLASAGGPGDLCSALCFGPWDLYLTLSFLDFKKGRRNWGDPPRLLCLRCICDLRCCCPACDLHTTATTPAISAHYYYFTCDLHLPLLLAAAGYQQARSRPLSLTQDPMAVCWQIDRRPRPSSGAPLCTPDVACSMCAIGS